LLEILGLPTKKSPINLKMLFKNKVIVFGETTRK